MELNKGKLPRKSTPANLISFEAGVRQVALQLDRLARMVLLAIDLELGFDGRRCTCGRRWLGRTNRLRATEEQRCSSVAGRKCFRMKYSPLDEQWV